MVEKSWAEKQTPLHEDGLRPTIFAWGEQT